MNDLIDLGEQLNQVKPFPDELYAYADKTPNLLPYLYPTNRELLEALYKAKKGWGNNQGDVFLSARRYHENPIAFNPIRGTFSGLPQQTGTDCVPIMFAHILQKFGIRYQYEDLKRDAMQKGDFHDPKSYFAFFKTLNVKPWYCGGDPADLTAAGILQLPIFALRPRQWHAYALVADQSTELKFSGNNLKITPRFFTQTTTPFIDSSRFGLTDFQGPNAPFWADSLIALIPPTLR